MAKFLSRKKGNWRPVSGKTKDRQRVVVAILVATAVLLFLVQTVSFVASYVAVPFVYVEHWVSESSSGVATYLRDRAALQHEIESLTTLLETERLGNQDLERLRHEHALLVSQLSGAASTSDRVAASVLALPPAVPYDSLVLDVGTADGVAEGGIVYGFGDQAIGVVSRVFSNSSVVTLLSTAGLESTAYIVGPNIYTTARGVGGGQLRVSVPQGIDLSVGDLVIVPTLGGGVYGAVSVVDSVDTRPEQYGYVSIGVPLSSVRSVTVGKPLSSEHTFAAVEEIINEINPGLLVAPVPTELLVVSKATAVSTTSTSTVESNTETE